VQTPAVPWCRGCFPGQARRRLRRLRRRPAGAAQNTEVAANAEHYYRSMVRADRQSWNVRDHHMADTVDRLARHLGAASKGIIWEHNTHVGDARGTDMPQDGLVNVGQLPRERHALDGVLLVGFAAHRGTVIAADSWGTPERIMPVPGARPGSHEDFLHEAVGVPGVLAVGRGSRPGWASGQSEWCTTRNRSRETTSRPGWGIATMR
jgi:erythromycin esterase